jgi:hypothetical protein
LFAVLLTGGVTDEGKPTARPNIIFVPCDDFGPGDLGVLWQVPGAEMKAIPNTQFQIQKDTLTNTYIFSPQPAFLYF